MNINITYREFYKLLTSNLIEFMRWPVPECFLDYPIVHKTKEQQNNRNNYFKKWTIENI